MSLAVNHSALSVTSYVPHDTFETRRLFIYVTNMTNMTNMNRDSRHGAFYTTSSRKVYGNGDGSGKNLVKSVFFSRPNPERQEQTYHNMGERVDMEAFFFMAHSRREAFYTTVSRAAAFGGPALRPESKWKQRQAEPSQGESSRQRQEDAADHVRRRKHQTNKETHSRHQGRVVVGCSSPSPRQKWGSGET